MARILLNFLSIFFTVVLLISCTPAGQPLLGPDGEVLGGNQGAPSQSELGQDTAGNTPIDCPDDWKDEDGVCHEPVSDFKTPEDDEGPDEDDDDHDDDEEINNFLY